MLPKQQKFFQSPLLVKRRRQKGGTVSTLLRERQQSLKHHRHRVMRGYQGPNQMRRHSLTCLQLRTRKRR